MHKMSWVIKISHTPKGSAALINANFKTKLRERTKTGWLPMKLKIHTRVGLCQVRLARLEMLIGTDILHTTMHIKLYFNKF